MGGWLVGIASPCVLPLTSHPDRMHGGYVTTLLTGGTGFLGRGIMKYMPFDAGHGYVVYSRDEQKQDACKQRFSKAAYRLGDVKDLDMLKWTIKRFEVDTIIHTAAIKYIPEAELNVAECISTNVDGSRNVARAAIDCDVRRVVGISTDKAAQPVNVYGASKMLMERLFGEFALIGKTRFTLTRYGNVVGSTGSVIPLFQKQLAEQGQVKLTDPYMTRFWISIEEAVNLVALALMAENGHMIVPKAKAMTMLSLVEALAGPAYEVIGVRPGEKRHEAMIHSYESVRATDCGHHYDIGSKVVSEPFAVTSNNPEVWLDEHTLKTYIKMAESI